MKTSTFRKKLIELFNLKNRSKHKCLSRKSVRNPQECYHLFVPIKAGRDLKQTVFFIRKT